MKLSKQDTLFLKGIAILLLLYHHMFFNDNNIIIFNIARNFKVCVGLFVCLSGYGLTKSYKNGDIWYKFIFKRLYKILPTYWIIFITTVLFGVIFNYRTLEEAYGNKIYLKTSLEFLGLHEFVYGHGYNATWWYMSLIIFLYVTFIVFYKFIKITKLYGIITIFLLSGVGGKIPVIKEIKSFLSVTSSFAYITCFILGIYLAMYDLKKEKIFIKIYWIFNKYVITMLLFLFVSLRLFIPYHILVEFIFVYLILEFYKVNNLDLKINRVVKSFINLLGKYSYEIFLTHSFLFYYYFNEYIYI